MYVELEQLEKTKTIQNNMVFSSSTLDNLPKSF